MGCDFQPLAHLQNCQVASSKIEKDEFNGTRIYILRSKAKKGIPSLECWITASSPHRIIKFIVNSASQLQLINFKYIEIARGIYYPISYEVVRRFPGIPGKRKTIVTKSIEVNIDIPKETFMFLPGKTDTKK